MRFGCRLFLTLMCMADWAQASVSESFLLRHHDRLDTMIQSLDSSIPELRQIMIGWQEGQRTAAEGLTDYFRHKQFDLSRMGPADIPGDYMQRVIAARDDTFLIHGSWIKVPRDSNDRLDWNYRGDSGDKEIAWMLNRHTMLPAIAKAWEESHDPELQALINRTLVDWIENSPYPDRISFSPQWRSLEAARRVLNSWIHIFYGPANILDDETILLVLSSIMDHADALLEHASFWGGNHLLTEKIGLLAIAAAWPEFKQSGKWKESAYDSISELLVKQFYPDGSYKELSNHYQRVVLSNTLPFLGLIQDDTAEYKDQPASLRILDMWEFFAWSMKPDGSGPVNNASDKEMNSDHVKSSLAHFDRPEWLGIATNGRQGILPTGSSSRIFPWAGQVFMRNNWSKSADWIYFDAGPYGTAHQHVDRLHLSVTLKGRDLLSDSGRYTYKPGKWRDYFKGPRSHSVALLDGQPARQGPREVQSPMDVVFQESDKAVYASASSSFHLKGEPFRAPVPWTRHVIYDRRGVVIVLDQVDAFKKYELEVLWQFSPGVSGEEARSVVQSSNPFLLMASTLTSGREDDPISGFFSPEYSQRIPTIQMNNKFRIQSPATIAHVIQSPGGKMMTVQTWRDQLSGAIKFTLFQDGNRFSEGEISTGETRLLTDYQTYPAR